VQIWIWTPDPDQILLGGSMQSVTAVADCCFLCDVKLSTLRVWFWWLLNVAYNGGSVPSCSIIYHGSNMIASDVPLPDSGLAT